MSVVFLLLFFFLLLVRGGAGSTTSPVEGSWCPAVQPRSRQTATWASLPAVAGSPFSPSRPVTSTPRATRAKQQPPCALDDRVALAPTPTLTRFYSARRVSASFYGAPGLGGSGVTRDWLLSPCTGAREESLCTNTSCDLASEDRICSFVDHPS